MLFVFGCAGVGNETLKNQNSATVAKRIVDGKTTQAQIRKMFGDPAKTSFTDNGLLIWTYSYADMHANAVDYIPIASWFGSSSSGKKKELVILFNKQNVVERYSMSSSNVSVKTGIYK